MTNRLSNVEPDVSAEGSSPLMHIVDLGQCSDSPFSGKSFSVVTFGCQMNKHDSERIVGMLTALGATGSNCRRIRHHYFCNLLCS